MDKQLKKILLVLKKKGTKERAEGQKKYLKSPYCFYGVVAKELDWAVKEYYFLNKTIDKEKLLKILQELWNSKWHTEKSFAISLATYYTAMLDEKELLFFKNWLDECTGWDHTDGISCFIIARMIEKNPKLKKQINYWTKEKTMWTRRSSLISYIRSIRKDKRDLQDIFNNIKPLMKEKEFFIRKAIGWILREASKKYSKDVLAFVKQNRKQLSNLSIREATRKIIPREKIKKLLN